MHRKKRVRPQAPVLERAVEGATVWVGSVASIVIHTVAFAFAFALVALGYRLETVLLALTTAVSLEAIYLALFIQMTVNRTTVSLQAVEEDLAEIEEGIDEIEKSVDEIEEDIAEIEKDIDDIEQDEEDQRKRDVEDAASLRLIEERLASIVTDLERLRR